MTRHCQISVATAQDRDTPSPLDRYCIVELNFWRDNLRRVNAREVFYCNPPFSSIFSDASDIAYGGHILWDQFGDRLDPALPEREGRLY